MNPLQKALAYLSQASQSPTAQAAKKIAMPPVPSAQPLQRGQSVASFPGYQEAQAQGGFDAPPQQVDIGALMGAIKSMMGKFGGESVSSFRKPGFENVGVQPAQAQQPTPQPTALPTQQPYPQATPIDIPQQRLAQNISNTWGKDTPMLQDLQTYTDAGNQLPGNMEKLLPIALALRETQGGKDLAKRDWGKNNPYNIRGKQNGKTQFISYPDVKTATFGGQNGDAQAQGLVGLLGKNPIYGDFRKSNDLADLFSHWSPQAGGNGPIQGDNGQVANLQYILSKLKQ